MTTTEQLLRCNEDTHYWPAHAPGDGPKTGAPCKCGVRRWRASLDTRRNDLFSRIATELDRAYAKHGREPWGRHEFYAILKEEVDELWDDVKRDAPQEALEKELVQVAAMCFRYFETGDRYCGSPDAV